MRAVTIESPAECTPGEISSFSDLVCRAFGSRDRTREIDRARALVFLREGEETAGVAALRVPTKSHACDVFRRAGQPPMG